jgi:hypothetical protein
MKQFDLFEELAQRFAPKNNLGEFFNTIHESGDTLKQSEIKAGTQNAEILEVFRRYPNRVFTPAEINQMIGYKWPFTSVRRGISTLTDMGYLVKTDIMRDGIFGKPNYCWKINFVDSK